jgi:UDP-N-acetylmuramyl tripeptide synthase
LSSVLHRSASQLPGRIALGIDPNLMGELSHKLRKGAIVVCGTNGKTTTNNVLASSIEAAGNTVLCNRAGANMAAGVTSALLPGKCADWAVMEADELSTVHILPNLRPRYLVLLNLFRDQLDRAGEIDHVQDTIVRALESSPETTLLACGDDPLSMGVARRAAQGGTKVLTFGVDEDLHLPADRVPEARFCQVCGAELEYEWRSYAQLGKFRCPNGDFARPALDFRATGVRVDRTGVSFDVEGLGLDGKVHLKAGFGGVYMAYNLLAAFAAASLAGVTGEQFQRTLDGYHPKNGRLQHFEVGGREVVLNLAKNPTGFNQNISLLLADDREKAAVLRDKRRLQRRQGHQLDLGRGLRAAGGGAHPRGLRWPPRERRAGAPEVRRHQGGHRGQRGRRAWACGRHGPGVPAVRAHELQRALAGEGRAREDG